MAASTRLFSRRAGSAALHRVLLACLAASLTGGAAATDYDRDDALAFSQGAIGRDLAAFTLRDTRGQLFDLANLRGKPLVISMIYTSCHHICPAITRNLGETVDVAREALGEDTFAVSGDEPGAARIDSQAFDAALEALAAARNPDVGAEG